MNVRGKRKIGRRFLAAALSVCMLLTVQPNLWDGVMVQAATSGGCGTGVSYTLDDAGVLTITGTGAMDNYTSQSTPPWYESRSSISSVIIENGVTSIGENAFNGCRDLRDVTIPGSVTSIGNRAFYGCIGLRDVTIPSNVTNIGEYAFNGCRDLRDVTIPGSVTDIGGCAFCGCSSLAEIVVENGNSKYDSRDNCNAIIDTDKNELVVGCKGTKIPESVTSIGEHAFDGCGLTGITIPSSVTSIGKYAFYRCESLMSVTIPSSVTSIGERAFWLCSSLTGVTIPNLVTSIGNSAFNSCTGLTSVTIPSSVTSIGTGVFSGCTGLTSVTIQSGVTSIGVSMFSGCTGLTSVTIPSSVTSIGKTAFGRCTGLTSVTIPSSVTSIGEYAFEGCSSLTSVTIPSSVTSIGGSAFIRCSKLTSVMLLGQNPPTIGSNIFRVCGFITNTERGIHVPRGTENTYKENWSDWKDYIKDRDAVKLNGNGGSGTDLTEYIYGMTTTLPTGWTKTGHDFAGWYEDERCEGTAVTEISATTTGDKEYYAKWTPKSYTVTLNGNEGSGGIDLTSYTYGTGATMPFDWTRAGYDFAGWYEDERCEGTAVTEISANDTGNKTFWAKWTPSSYTISYELDGGMVTGNPTNYTIESDTITLINPTKEGYTFTGWSGTDLTGNNNMSVTIAAGSTGDREYTAHWTDADYKVTLNGNGGKGGTALSSYKHGTEAALPTDWTRAGYTFAGWYGNEECTGTVVTKIPDTAAGDREYWAGWTANSYSISYNLDGGTVAGNPTSYTVESSTITLNNPTKEGYTFTGWSGTDLTDNSTGVTIASGSTGNRTYTAHWKLADYTVTLHTNGGTGGTDLTSYTFGTGAVLPTNWQKAGYAFDGWYVNENFTETAVTNISGTDTGNKEYWAKWTDNIAPVIGTLSYDYQPKNLWQWLIGKDSLVITVPVTEEGSGADNITYTETPDGKAAREETANITDGKAEITVSADFKGTISIACTDKANNTSARVTVGAGLGANGIIIEDNAPQIAFQAENAELLPSGEYKTVPDIVVTAADDKNNVISGGIASVSYKIGNGSEKAVAHDYTTSMIVNDSFTIPAGEISAGETEITVTATDNAGNSVTQNYTVKVHTHSGTLVPAVEPTCTTAGNKAYYTCTCGKEFSDSGCTNEITDHTEVIKDALGHDFTGKYQFDTEEHWMKCSRCDATDSREAHSFEEGSNCCAKCEFEKAGEGHTHRGELHERVEPTCTTKGYTAYYTCNCGKWFSDSSCTVEITDKSKIEIAALEHDFVMKHDQNEHWQQCSRCSLEQSRGLHEYDDDSDTDCNVCGYVRTIQHTHSGTLVPAVEPTCTEDGHEAYYTCSCRKWFSDSGCVNEIADHASVTVEKRGHDFSGGFQSDENGHWKVCSRCNVAQAAESHVFDNEYDTDCNQCGYRRNTGNQGNVSKDVEKDEKAPDTVLSDSAEELADIILTEEEKGQIGNGADIKFILNVKDAGDTVSSGDKTAVQQVLGGNAEVNGFSIGQYLDISLFKVIGDTRSAISQTARKLAIVIHVPDSLKSKDSAKPRTYAIIRVHDGVAEVLADLDGDADAVTIATDRFSAYVLVYKEAGSGADVTPSPTPDGGDQPTPTPGGSETPSPTPDSSIKPTSTPDGKDNVTPAPLPTGKSGKASDKVNRKIEIHSRLKAIQTGKKLQISWGRVSGADGYSVYVQYCGKNFSAKSLGQVKSGRKTKITVKKVNGKKLATTKNFKLYVVAWKWKKGKKSTLAKTLMIYVAGKDSVKYTNVKRIRLKKASYSLKKNGTVTLRPKTVLKDKHKKQISAAHCKKFRYLSSNKKVATVTAGGKVKAKGSGECTIYVLAKNGCRRKIKIKVKK